MNQKLSKNEQKTTILTDVAQPKRERFCAYAERIHTITKEEADKHDEV